MRVTSISLLSLFSFTGALAADMVVPLMDVNVVLGFDAGPDNFYNAPIPPWMPGAVPGWYYGPNPQKYPDLWTLHDFMCRFLWYYPDALHCPPPKPTPSPQPTTTTKTSTTTTTKTSTTTATKTSTTTATSTSTTTKTVVSTSTTTSTTTSTVTVTASPTPIDGYIPTFTNFTAAVQANDFMTFGLVETVADCMAMCDSVPGCTFVNPFHDVNGKGGSTDLTCSLFKFCHTLADADNAGGQSQPNGSIDFIINSDGWCKVGNATTPITSSSSSSSAVSSTSAIPSSNSTATTKTTTTSKTSTTTAPVPTGTGIAHYYQCGGLNYVGSTICVPPYTCVYQNPYYSQCV